MAADPAARAQPRRRRARRARRGARLRAAHRLPRPRRADVRGLSRDSARSATARPTTASSTPSRWARSPSRPTSCSPSPSAKTCSRRLEGTVFHDSIQSALAKIRAGLGPELSGYLERLGDALPRAARPAQALCGLPRDDPHAQRRRARARAPSRCATAPVGRARSATRRIDPYKVWYHGGALYVIGHDHRSGEIRTFAVDRIRAIERDRRAFERRPELRLRPLHGVELRCRRGARVPVRIRFDEPGPPMSASGSGTRANRPATSRTAGSSSSMEVGGGRELASWVLSFGDRRRGARARRAARAGPLRPRGDSLARS